MKFSRTPSGQLHYFLFSEEGLLVRLLGYLWNTFIKNLINDLLQNACLR
ncbi:hypothetical protein [Rhodohalobacter halophilus]|nr:hypothetical protein [Rhodohalobacter halophilus]